MPTPLNLTYEYLTRVRNPAAVEVLIAGLESGQPIVRDHALRALLTRPDPAGHHAVFRCLKSLDQRGRRLVAQRADRLAKVAGEALQSSEPGVAQAACDAVLDYRLYDALPGVIAALGKESGPQDLLASTVLRLAESLYGELCSPGEQRDLEAIRARTTSTLEQGVGRFNVHRRKEVVEAFLMLTRQQNVVLRRVLQYPQDAVYQATMEILERSGQGGVIRLLMGLLEDPQVPQAIRGVIARRCDLRFVKPLLQVVREAKQWKSVQEMFARLEQLSWAVPGHELLRKLDDQGQADAVAVVVASGLKRESVREVLGYLLTEGNLGGRRAAAEALAQFPGPESDALVMRSLSDKDPLVRAHLARQLRPRKIPGAMSLLVRMADSTAEEVRQALRDSLPEFTVRHFMIHFDRLPEEWIVAIGNIVRKIDLQAAPLLAKEMTCLSPVRRRRAVQAAMVMGMVRELESTLIELLADEDHMVRIEVAKALANCDSMPSWEALRDALLDRSVIVQEVAEQSLEQISRSMLEAIDGVEDPLEMSLL